MSFFEVELTRVQVANVWRSESQATSEKAAKLQALFDKRMSKKYEEEKAFFEKKENGGAKFRLTDGKVFELFQSEKTIKVPIKFQVKGGTMTWYFIAPKDETHQTWRDELYMTAAVGHLTVDQHCEKYWRGTNSFHLKWMHTRESEDQCNHNHYRLENDIDANPAHVKQHLLGFVAAQREIDEERGLGVLNPSKEESLTDKFLDLNEANEISRKFNIWWIKVNHSGQAKEVDVEGEHILLPDREESLVSAYKKSPKQALTPEDEQEWNEHKHEEEPCRSILQGAPIKEKMNIVKAGMRGTGSELANTRQVSWSRHAKIETIVRKDDKFTKPP
jgi:hypothetical protein